MQGNDAYYKLSNDYLNVERYLMVPKMTVIISDYVKSCSKCQARKLGRPTKPNITAFPTLAKPFDVWALGIYGPLPVTPSGKSYIFTAVDLFSKFLYTVFKILVHCVNCKL